MNNHQSGLDPSISMKNSFHFDHQIQVRYPLENNK